jgi:hypothetical protein
MGKDGLNADDAAKVLGVSRRTLFRGLRAARALLLPLPPSQEDLCRGCVRWSHAGGGKG